jgi:hypothetical protein
LHRCGPSQEVEIKDTAQNVVFQVCAISIIDLHIHSIGIEQENAVSAITSTVIVVHRMIAIEIRSRRDTVRISIPNRARVVCGVEHERVSVLPETIQAWRIGKMSPEAHILALEY